MLKRYLLAAAVAMGAATLLPVAGQAAEGHIELKHLHLPTDGFFGTFDRAAVQRGFQVYHEVCGACHGLKFVAYRNLAALGYNEDQIKAIAATATVTDGPNDQGEMFDRPGLPFDHITGPFANEQAAAAANGGKAPPDLSLMAKAREGGESYIYSILTGYEEAPAEMEIPEGGHFNAFFPGHVIAMPKPISDGQVDYTDGTPATLKNYSDDVSAFLMWLAEPKLEERKKTGFRVLVFMAILTGLLYATKKRVWASTPH